jgi:hypothetical protein
MFCFLGLLAQATIVFLNTINPEFFVMKKYVLFAVGTGFFKII